MSVSVQAKDPSKEEEEFIFRLVQEDIKLKEIRDHDKTKSPFRLTTLVKASDVTIFALSDSVYRIVASARESQYNRLNVPLRTDDQVDHIFLDHTGYHCIISLCKGDCYYVYCASTPIKLSRMQGSVQSVAFSNHILDQSNNHDLSIVMLIGTSVGLLYEVSFSSEFSFAGKALSLEKSCRVAHKLDHPIAIICLSIELLHCVTPTNSSSSNNDKESQVLVLCGTSSPTRLYHFIGKLPAARQSFNYFFSLLALSGDNSFTELPTLYNGRGSMLRPSAAGRFQCSSIPCGATDTAIVSACNTDNSSSNSTKANNKQIFALMTELGIYYGPLSIFDVASINSAETVRTDTTDSSSCEEESAGAQLMPYTLPSLSRSRSLSPRASRMERGGAGGGGGDAGNPCDREVGAESSSSDDSSQSDSIDDNDHDGTRASPCRDGDESPSPSCLPLSIAVTDFHFLVLARVYSQRAKSISKSISKSKSRVSPVSKADRMSSPAVRRVEGERRAERSSKTRYKRSSRYYLIAMSRLDGSLSQCIDLTPQQPSSSIVRLKQHSQPQVVQHSGRPLLAVPSVSREEGLEGVPLGLFADTNVKTKCVWLYTDRGLYQVEIDREDRVAWRSYLSKALAHSLSQSLECRPVGGKDGDKDRGGRDGSGGEKLFKQAMLYCKHDSERSTVSHSHAESLLVRGKPEEAARIYALSNAEFDMVVLRLLSVLSPPPLCSSLNEPDSGAASELLYGNLRESSPSTHSDTDSNPQSHSAHPMHDAAVSAALLQYLSDKLEQLFPSPTPTPSSQRVVPSSSSSSQSRDGSYSNSKSKSKSTMICTWIAELMLHRIVALEFLDTAPTADVTSTTIGTDPLKVKLGQPQLQFQPHGVQSKDGREVQVQVQIQGRTSEGPRLAALLAFKEFLRKYKSTLDHATMLSLLRSRCNNSGNSCAAKSLLLFYSQIVGDYDTLVAEYMTEGNYRAAIAVLGDAAAVSVSRVEALLYKHAPLLMDKAPEATANLLLRVGLAPEKDSERDGAGKVHGQGLSMSGLLPAFLRYTEMYEKGRCRGMVRERSGVTEEEGRKSGSSVTPLVHASSPSSSSSSSSTAMGRGRGGERERALLACVPGAPDTATAEKNYAVWCLRELYDRSRYRAAPETATLPAPPPLLLQTLLWLLIRSEEGEGSLIQVLLPYCERAVLTQSSKGDGDGEGDGGMRESRRDTSPHTAVPPLRTETVPDVDLEFLMRECKRRMKKDVTCSRHGTVSVLCALLWREQESVTAALQVSVPFAKEMCRMLCAQQASLPDLGPKLGVRFKTEVGKAKGTETGQGQEREITLSKRERSKRLWMIIASHLLSPPSLTLKGNCNGNGHGEVEVDQSENAEVEMRTRTEQARSVLALLEESGGALLIEDLLVKLPDFSRFDLFKEGICKALQDSSRIVGQAKCNMDELADQANLIVQELEEVKSRGYSMSSSQQCEFCNTQLFSCPEQFYIFPCSHGFCHTCLYERAQDFFTRTGDAEKLKSIRSLENRLRLLTPHSRQDQAADKRAQTELDILQGELDGYMAADCPLCGYTMIRSLGLPLIAKGDLEESLTWRL